MRKLLFVLLLFCAISCQEKEVDVCQYKGRVIIAKDWESHPFSKKDYYLVFRKGDCAFEKVVVEAHYYWAYDTGDKFLGETLRESIDRQRKELDSVFRKYNVE